MWPRKQLDIGWRELARGLRSSIFRGRRPTNQEVLGSGWISADDAVVSLSVRTAWDLMLQAWAFPPGSEIVVSCVTIPDMIRIIEHHGLVAVPVAVSTDCLEPAVEDIAGAITSRTRAILVAHLFGARIDMNPIAQLAQQRGLLVVEDCAQAFVGRAYSGHPDSDCCLFSFGPIKTATALGGAIARVRSQELRARMLELQNGYAMQSSLEYLQRLIKYGLYRVMSWPWLYGQLARVYRVLGADFDRAVAESSRSFPGVEFFERIRRRPCNVLLRLLEERLETFETQGVPRLQRRTWAGNRLAAALPAGMVVGGRNETHTFWVMPLRVANAAEMLAALRRAGFDATSRSSLVAVRHPESAAQTENTEAWLAETIFLPNGHDIPDSEWRRMTLILRDVARLPANEVKHDKVDTRPVSAVSSIQ